MKYAGKLIIPQTLKTQNTHLIQYSLFTANTTEQNNACRKAPISNSVTTDKKH